LPSSSSLGGLAGLESDEETTTTTTRHSSDSDSDSVEERDSGSEDSSSDDSDESDEGGEEEEEEELSVSAAEARLKAKAHENEEIGMLLEISLLELILTCDEEGHAVWEMKNATTRKFANPFASVREFVMGDGSLLFVDDKNIELLKVDVTFDAQGHLSLAREDGGIVILQKVGGSSLWSFLFDFDVFEQCGVRSWNQWRRSPWPSSFTETSRSPT